MQICDKCKKSGKLTFINLENRKFEICESCILKIIKFIEQENKSPFDAIFKNSNI